MSNPTEPSAPDEPDAEPVDRDELKVRALQHLIRGAIADTKLRGTGVVKKLDAALRGESPEAADRGEEAG